MNIRVAYIWVWLLNRPGNGAAVRTPKVSTKVRKQNKSKM